jgi:hypothetical protein
MLHSGHPETSSSPVTRGCFGTSRAYWPQGFSLSAILNERFFQAAHIRDFRRRIFAIEADSARPFCVSRICALNRSLVWISVDRINRRSVLERIQRIDRNKGSLLAAVGEIYRHSSPRRLSLQPFRGKGMPRHAHEKFKSDNYFRTESPA